MSALPGFLRRSLRAEYSEEDDDLDNESVGSSSSATSLSDQQKEQDTKKNGESAGNESDDISQEKSEQSSTRGSEHSQQQTTATPSKIPIQSNSSGRRSSEPVFLHASDAQATEDTSEGSSFHESFRMERQEPQKQQHLSSAKRTKTYRESQFEKIFAPNVISMNDLRTLSWNGIPPPYRTQAWKILLGYLPTNSTRRKQTLQKKRTEYKDAIAQHYDIEDDSRTVQEQEVLRQVLVDVPRTAPSVQLFRNNKIQKLLARLLYIWAMRHPASSYVQGINDLAMPLIVAFLSDRQSHAEVEDDDEEEQVDIIDYDMVLDGTVMDSVSDEILEEVEADVYYCLTNLLAGIQDHYTSDQPGVQRMVLRLEELVNRIDADLCAHLRETGIEFMQFAFKWMNCLLLREFDLKCVIRLWDTYISETDGFEDFHVYVCAAFLCQFSSQLQSMSFDDLFGFMQDIPTSEWGDTEVEMLLSQAYVLSTLFGGSDAHLTAANNARF